MIFNDGSCKWELKRITNAEQLNGLNINELMQNIKSGIEIFYGTIKPNIELGREGQALNVIVKMGIQFSLPRGYTKEQCKILAFGAKLITYDAGKSSSGSSSVYETSVLNTPIFYEIDSDGSL